MSEFNGTNPLLDALGDQPTIRDVTINNNTSFKIVEPLTGLQIQTETIVRVHGEVAFQQIQNNIVQLNELQQQEAVTSTAVVVDDQPPASWSLTNCTVVDGLLTYARDPSETEDFLFAEKALALGETVTLDFKVALNEISSFTVFVDDCINGYDRYTVNSAVILQDFDRAQLIAQQDWDIDYRVNLIDQTTYMASIYRSDLDTVILHLSDLNGNVLKERTVTIQNVELKRIWISVGLINNVEFSATLLSTFDNE